MKKIILLNSAVMPNEGVYILKKITPERAKEIITSNYEIESYIGYPDTARFMESILGITIPINRTKVILQNGDIAIVCRLKYRVKNPKDKGRFVPKPDDYEWYLETYSKEVPIR